jgi:tetratricopeptide (TPR) repeat protein
MPSLSFTQKTLFMKKTGIVIILTVITMLSFSQSATDDFYKGVDAAARDDYEKAVVHFTAAIDKEYYLAEAWYNRGLAYSKLSLYYDAITDYTEAIRLSPSMAKAYLNRGADYITLNEKGKALQDYNAAIYLDSTYTSAYFNRGTLFYQGGNYANALFDFNKTVKLDSNGVDGWYNLGLVEEKLQRFADAIEHFSKALQLDGKNIVARKHRARCFYEAGFLKEALDDCAVVLKKVAGDEEALVMSNEVEKALQDKAVRFSSYNTKNKRGKNQK